MDFIAGAFVVVFVVLVAIGLFIGILVYLLAPPESNDAVARYKKRERDKAAVEAYKADQARRKLKK